MPLNPDQWREVERLFARVVDLDPASRAAILDREGAGGAVRREVERLLTHDQGATGRIAAPIRTAIATTAPGAQRERIGPYRILRELGRGGMGAVFLAARDDDQYRKQVAIKFVSVGMDSDTLVRRFRAERQILATLEHPHIARLLEGGTTDDGLPYLVMEYVEGEPIDTYCDRGGLGINARLGLFRSVCGAVQHAHRNLIVHRDIKPANILVTADGVPKLLDFGIAKLLDTDTGAAGHTLTAARMMTPAYASPEQVRGEPITTASDVYSLGVLLYELLTGRRPYRLASGRFEEVARAVTDQEPELPSAAVTREPEGTTSESLSRARAALPADLRRRLAGDLDDIVLMTLRKEPERRYATVAELEEDIRRHLEGLPVLARKDTWGYRASKFSRRHPWRVGAFALSFVLIVGSSFGFFLQARRIAGQRDRALAAEGAARTEAATAARVTDFLVELFEYSDPAEARGRAIPVREVLDRGARRIREDLDDEAGAQSRLLATMAQVYGNLGLYDAALPLSEEALEKEIRLHGENAPEVARARARRGALLAHLERRDEAEPEILAALKVQRERLGPEHDDIVVSLNTLGMLRALQGRYAEAEAQHREALAMAKRLHGDRHELVGRSADNLGLVLDQKGPYEEAERVLRDNLAMRRDLLGEDHPQVAASLNNLGQVLVRLGRLDEAEQMLRQNLALTGRLNGEESFAYTVSLSNLAYALKEEGRPAEAEPLQRRALDLTSRLLGPEHPQTASRMNNLANLVQDQGKFAEAESLHRRLLDLNRRVQGDKHPETAGTLNNLASLLWDLERYDEAEPLFREAIAADRETLGPEHGFVAMDLCNLAVVLRDRGRAGDRRETETLFVDAVRIARKAFGETHPNVAVNQVQYGIFLARTGRVDAGEREVREALRIFEVGEGPDHFHVDLARVMLGECLSLRGLYEEAEPLLVEGHDALSRKLGAGSGVTRRTRAQIVRFYTAWGKPDRAAAYRENGGPG